MAAELFIQVVTTVGEKTDAKRIATALLEKRLAGCVQILGPIESGYWWQGRQEYAQEWQCLIKSRRGLFGELEVAIRELHPYENPEIIALPILAGSDDYLNWLQEELKKG